MGNRSEIVRALYGGKIVGSYLWHHLRSCMAHLRFECSKSDPDVWMRRSVRKYWDNVYHEYKLIYVDNCLVISDRDESMIRNEIGRYFCLKEEFIGDPGQYLGKKLSGVVIENGLKTWDFGSKQYVEDRG